METATYSPCSNWRTSEGAAWPWCDHCGVRADLHPDSPLAEAVRRKLKSQ